MRKFKVSLLVMVVLGTLFGTGCNDMHNVFHERSGVMVASIAPMVLRTTATTTNETELVNSNAFPSASISFTNLNAIEARIRAYRIDFYETATGIKKDALTASGTTFLRVGPVTVGNTQTTAGTGTTQATGTTGQTAATAQTQTQAQTAQPAGLVINPWSEAVKNEIYGNLTTRTDNKSLEARVDIFGEDDNGNTFVLNAAFTLIP